MGPLLLAGGAEFGRGMSEPDLRAIQLAGGFEAPIRILPTAAAPDNNQARAGDKGIRWFRSLGATDVQVVEVIDQTSANDPHLEAILHKARLIYMLGGFPKHLGETLMNSLAWNSVLLANQAGAVLAGSSAGAMVLCEDYYDPYVKRLMPGLNLIHKACVLPHHNSFGRTWVTNLSGRLPGSVLIGIDESTGMIKEADGWKVYGTGAVTLYRGGESAGIFSHGDLFNL